MADADISARLTLNAEKFSRGFQDTVDGFSREANMAGERMVAGLGGSLRTVTGLVGTFGAAFGVIGGVSLAGFAAKSVEVNREFGKLNAQLITATGSADKAGVAFEALERFAQETPYGLAQAVDGFVRLKNLGLTPSERALRSYGNTASAMGKDLNQMIEAVADASTGEFERLKEFGIRASNEGATIAFTFQGVTTRVANNAAEIEEYLRDIGETKFGGAMAAQMKELEGAFANLEDNAAASMRAFGEAGFNGVLLDMVQRMGDAADESKVLATQLGAFSAEAYHTLTSAAGILVDDIRGTFRALERNVWDPLRESGLLAFADLRTGAASLRAEIGGLLESLDAVKDFMAGRQVQGEGAGVWLANAYTNTVSTIFGGRNQQGGSRSTLAQQFQLDYVNRTLINPAIGWEAPTGGGDAADRPDVLAQFGDRKQTAEAAASARDLAAAERDRAKAQREAEQAAKALAAENKRLVDSYAPLAAAAAKYETALAEIELAEQRGLITTRDTIHARIDAWEQLAAAQKKATDAALEAGGSTLVAQGQALGDRAMERLSQTSLDALQKSFEAPMKEAGLKVAREFEDKGLIAVQAIAQTFRGEVGGEVSKIAGLLRGLGTGDFTSMGGAAGGILTLLSGGKGDSAVARGMRDVFRPVTDELKGVFKDLDLGGADLGGLAGTAMAGAGIGGLVGGGTAGSIGGALGSLAGSAIGGPLGSLVGGVLGGAVGGLFKSTKSASVTLGARDGDIFVGNPIGKGSGHRAAATQLGGSVGDALDQIITALDAELGTFAVSIGQRKDYFAVDPTGRNANKSSKGAIHFDTAEEAMMFALRDAISDGAVAGVSQTIQNALRRASSVEKGLEDALAIQSISERLREFEDPVGAAIGRLDKEFRNLRETLEAAGSTTAELADLEKLYGKERERVMEQQLSTLEAFRDSLMAGSDSPLSLRDQVSEAEKRLAEFERDISAGVGIDQAAFVDAGRLRLDLERQISGGTAGFFEQFDRVQRLTNEAISGIENATPVDLFARETATASKSTAESTAELLNNSNFTNQLLQQLLQQTGGAVGGFVGAGAVARGFAR